MESSPLLLCYDGSEDAAQAIRRAAALFGARPAITLTAWQPAVLNYSYRWPGLAAAPEDEDLDAATEAAAKRVAEQGAAIARDAGLAPEAMPVRAPGHIWEAVVNSAAEFGAGVLVLGARGLGATRSVLGGSVSAAVVHHARRPVLVVRHGSVPAEGQVLIAYDGSPDAARAITHAGALLPGRYATVLTVQRPVQPALAHPWKGAAFERQFEHLDTAAQEAAQARVAEGVELASAAGLDAQPLVCVADGPVWQKILHAADERDAGVVVLGSRGFGELQALLRHGVSSPALRHTHRPLLIVSHGATDAPVPLAAPTGEGSERPSP